jgi:mannitol/fructose-specific phosphotransferase system IIA component
MEAMERTLIMLPKGLKAKLKALRAEGYTASGFIRALLEREFQTKPQKKKGA